MGILDSFKQQGSDFSATDALSDLAQMGKKVHDLSRNAAETGKRAQKTARDGLESRMPFPDADIQAYAKIDGQRCIVGFYPRGLQVHMLAFQGKDLGTDMIKGYSMAFSAVMGNRTTTDDLVFPYYMMYGLERKGALIWPRVEIHVGKQLVVFSKHSIAGATTEQVYEYLRNRTLGTAK